jgi:hypothetical protein
MHRGVEPTQDLSESPGHNSTSMHTHPKGRAMTSAVQNIDKPNETRPFRAHGQMDVVTLGDFTLGRGTFEPGWRWSDDVKPIAGTDSCQVRHTGICLSGQMTIKYDDGTETTIGPGDVMIAEPGHDAWVLGDEPCVLIDTGVAAYAKPS